MAKPGPARLLLRRAVAWLSRNPAARADALDLTVEWIRGRAAEAQRSGELKKANRRRNRATILEVRARQLREEA